MNEETGSGSRSLPNRWKVSSHAEGERLDSYLATIYGTSRSRVVKWIQAGRVAVGQRPVKPSLRLEGGEWISCEPLTISQDGRLEPEEGALSILYEDRHLVILDKPPDLVVHPGAGQQRGTLAHRLLARYPEIGEVGGPGRPGIVHRLDKGTSGVMVVARTAMAFRALSSAFSDRAVEKSYLAVVWGAPDPKAGAIEAPVARHPVRRKEMTISARGRPARSHYRTVATAKEAALLEIDLETGRTHQIRVHLKHLGHPILGDPIYGEARWKGLPRKRQKLFRELERPALHAWHLAFRHPESDQRIEFWAPPAPDFSDLWQRLSGSELPITDPSP